MSNNILLKVSALAIATAVSGAALGYFLKNFIAAPSVGSLVAALVVSVVFLAVFLLQTLLSPHFWVSAGSVLAGSLGAVIFFLSANPPLLAVGFLAMLGFLLAAYRSGKSELNNNLQIHFSKTSRIVMGFATMGLAIFASLVYVGSFDLKNPTAAKQNLEVLIRPAEPLVARYVPDFSSQNTLRQIAAKVLPAEFKLAPEAEKQQAITEVSSRLAQTVSNFAGVPVSASDRVIDIVYKATIGRILSLPPLAKTLLLIGFALVFFFFFKFLLFFVDWGAVLAGYGMFKALEAAGFFKIELQNVPKRVIVLK